jgi:hypothetical protein
VFAPLMYRPECFQGSFCMKRRSARPFMVEVKHTRTARTSLTSSHPATRSDKSLWPELAAAEVKPTPPDLQPAPAPRQEERPAQAPARRVLPSLVPMFEISAEPEATAASEAEPAATPRVRRPRARVEQASAVATAPRAPVVEPAAKPRRVAPRPAPAVAPEAPEASARAIPAPSGQAPSPRPVPSWRRGNELRLGERWKRRLPQYCR